MEPTMSTSKQSTTNPKNELSYKRSFSKEEVHPFDDIEWEMRSATITNEKGEIVFSQENVEVPTSWSQMATNVVVSKYFRGALGSIERETSVKQLISRVAQTISSWAKEGNYFQKEYELQAFEDDLTYLLLHQMMAFNSPVWFNVGIEDHPQCSACFINSVEDDMASILDLAKTEGMLFKGGSGSGTNLSSIRSSKEALTGGGNASGPVSFMRGYDAFAGVIKSGGKTRRAAKMVILDIDHPDIEEFIDCKKSEEKKAWALIDAGYDGSFTGEAYSSVFFQNSNNSVRVSDKFMNAVENQTDWTTKAVRDGRTIENIPSQKLIKQIADAAWFCGDPGIQFDDTINDWHTCAQTDRIYASNPCSEYMFLNDTACNLASLNLMKFQTPEGTFDIEGFENACRTTILAQEIIVDNASYPTERIEENSHTYRPLGIGYANLGALLMSKGLPYDSEEGRAYAAAITALMTGHSYLTSAMVAAKKGAFAGYTTNRESMLGVIRKHADHVYNINKDLIDTDLFEAAAGSWEKAFELGKKVGFRNSQVSVLAPTGTIAFMMDCDTTGIEPDIALVKYKKMVGDGFIKIVNRTVPMALKNLGYTKDEIEEIITYIDEYETIEGCELIKDEHLAVFDCAIKPASGTRFIHHMGHINMMSATQPFLSGAISKTVNLPHEITPDEIAQIYTQAWKKGLKAIAIYRDGCKRSQPLNTSATKQSAPAGDLPKPYRKRLPEERTAITHKFSVGGHEGYITVGMYEDGSPGEIFLVMSKEGTVVSGLMDSFATSISLALQYGVPLEILIDKFSHSRFEPSGMTSNPQIPMAKSVVDYIFRWMASKFLQPAIAKKVGVLQTEDTPVETKVSGATLDDEDSIEWSQHLQADAPPCPECGSMTIRNGICYSCPNCGATTGCS